MLWLLRPSSRLKSNPIADTLAAAAATHGIHSSRLIFADRVPKVLRVTFSIPFKICKEKSYCHGQAEHLRRHAVADLFIDTFYYGAHSTATDSLRGGLPVLRWTVPAHSSTH